MKQYIDLCKRILNEGTLIENKRTGKNCLTIINADLEYDVGNNIFPILTTRKINYKAAIAELLGYLRGYDSAAQFREIGCNTWDANANENEDWLNNPYRKGKDDMGLAYRFRGLSLSIPDYEYDDYLDQFSEILMKLAAKNDDRGLIMTAWHPHTFELACLRPCLHTYQFSLINDTLYMNAFQRSCDVPLGLAFNQIQCFVLLALMARITGFKAGKVYHKIVNAHIYEDQIPLMKEQIKREPFDSPQLEISEGIVGIVDLCTWVDPKTEFEVVNYQYHESIKYPFSV